MNGSCFSKHRKTILGVVLICCLIITHTRFGFADIAPPPPPVGSDLSPSISNTNVRMVSEYVLLDIAGYSEHPSGHANVSAHFVMRNLGDTEEHMQVRFPMNHAEYGYNKLSLRIKDVTGTMVARA